MPTVRLSIIACCLAAAVLAGCGTDEPERRAAPAPEPLLTERAPDKAWARDFDGTWDAFSPLLTERAPDKAWATDFDPLWSAWKACPGPRVAKKRARRRPAPSATPVTIEAARERFATFAGNWMAKVDRNLKHSRERMAVDSGPQGFVARFTSVAEDTLVLQVKASPSPGCDYVGVMRYEEHQFENRGGSYGEAVDGPFSRIRRMRITEIFRFVAGRWVN